LGIVDSQECLETQARKDTWGGLVWLESKDSWVLWVQRERKGMQVEWGPEVLLVHLDPEGVVEEMDHLAQAVSVELMEQLGLLVSPELSGKKDLLAFLGHLDKKEILEMQE